MPIKELQPMPQRPNILAGVIEGFYGQPWSQVERFELFEWMAAWGLNTYLYAPKDDLKHRAIWREPYTSIEGEALGVLIRACQQRQIFFIYAIGPGLDIRYSNESDVLCLKKRFEQMEALGCRHFALLFDDIPDCLDSSDIRRWGSLASAQCHLANTMFQWSRERFPEVRYFFCPTPYCGRMAASQLGGEGYLSTAGRELLPEIDVFWTGPEIISAEITVSHIQELKSVLHRSPIIWDNLFANDYDGRRFYCGPYAGRPLELKGEVGGVLCNPNNEFPLNYVPLRSLAMYADSNEAWDPRQSYLSAMQEWHAFFRTVGSPVAIEDLVLLGDCYYLPHQEGPEANRLYGLIRDLLSKKTADWGEQAMIFQTQAFRLRDFCSSLAGLGHRPLFYALSRRLWELREELDLLGRYTAFHSQSPPSQGPFHSDFHLPATYRGGMVSRLQRLLTLHADESFTPAPTE